MLDAQSVALQVASLVLATLAKVPTAYRDLADQARRAATSIPLNIAGASGRTGKDRCHHFRIAYGSAQETAIAVELLRTASVVSSADEAALLPLLDRVRAMTWRLAGR